MTHVPAFRPVFSGAVRKYTAEALQAILESGQLILGPYTEEFEGAFGQACAPTARGVAVSSGTVALTIALRCLDVEGADVLVPTNTNYATAFAVLEAGGRPVFYDSGLYPDADDLKAKISSRTRAVIVVHIGGHIPHDLPDLVAYLAGRGIDVVEDCAHAHGSELDGRRAGTFGRVAAFSFFPTKVISTFEGGMIISDDEAIVQLARSYRDQGKDDTGNLHVVLGSSWRMTEIGAALGVAQMATFDADLANRNSSLNFYHAALGDAGLLFPPAGPRERLSGHKAIATLPGGVDRATLRARAAKEGVTLGRGVYEYPLDVQPVFARFRGDGRYAVATQFAGSHICLPLWTGMERKQLETVTSTIGNLLRSMQ